MTFCSHERQTALDMKKSSLLALLLLCAAPGVAAPVVVTARAPQGTAVPGFSSAQAQRIVGEKSRAVVRALQNNDTRALAKFVHPTRGVRFSPYVNADARDRTIKCSQMPYLANHPCKWNWGEYDGSGEPMNLTWNEFRRKMLVPHSYIPGAREDFNLLSQNGNMPNRLLEVYPGAIFARYYLPGANPDFGGLDWRTLFLAWRPVGKTWYLVGVANDEWTT